MVENWPKATTFTFQRVEGSEMMTVKRDGEPVSVRVRIDIDAGIYVIERLDGHESARVDMADDHARLKLEAAIQNYLDREGGYQ